MSSTPCLCRLARPDGRLLRSRISGDPAQLIPAFASFSTSAQRPAAAAPKKRSSQSFKLAKKGGPSTRSNPPKIGERKAMRKRIVLSNTSALVVPDLKEMNAENVKDPNSIGTMLALSGPVIDQLRAVQAFKPPQAWHMFRRPCILVRKETVELAKEMDSMGKKTVRRIYNGDRGTGKSLLLLQAMAIAFQNDWIIISIPEAQNIVDGSSDYQPIANSKPPMYEQGQYAMEMLRRTVAANPILKNLKVKLQHKLPTSLPSEPSLFDLCDLGVEDSTIAAPVLAAFLRELESSDGPPALLALDGLGHAMSDTDYKSPTFEPIHAHDFFIINWFMSYLSGEKKLANGGLVLAATSTSNSPNAYTMKFRLQQLDIKQSLEKNTSASSEKPQFADPTLPFLLATGQQPNPVPQPDPYFKYDERVFKVLGSPFGVTAGSDSAKDSEISVQEVKGMTKEEARGLMEYWAKSGLMRKEVTDGFVAEKWSLAAGGIARDLERSCLAGRI